MTRNAVQSIVFSQVSLLGFLLLCLLLIPHFLLESNEGGVSNYGIHAKTFIPYTLAFGLCGLLTLRAAWLLPHNRPHYRPLRLSLIIVGILFLLVLFTTYPYKVNSIFDNLHLDASTALILFETALSLWWSIRLVRDLPNFIASAAQLVGFVLALLTRFNVIHWLFVAELVLSTAFAVIIVRVVAWYCAQQIESR